jgi:hypothetical protein
LPPKEAGQKAGQVTVAFPSREITPSTAAIFFLSLPTSQTLL